MSVNNPPGFHWRRRVEFAETDMAGIAHFSSFIIYMEQAEHALLRSLGTSVFEHSFASGGSSVVRSEGDGSGSPGKLSSETVGLGRPSVHRNVDVLTWPRVHCECDYLAPARFEEELDIFVTVARLGDKSVTYLHRLFSSGREIATGKIVAVCSMVNPETGVLTGIRIPEHLRELLSEYATEPK